MPTSFGKLPRCSGASQAVGYDLTLSDDERFELTMAVAATHASLHDVEVTLRQSIVPI
jgi:hypothetical protein